MKRVQFYPEQYLRADDMVDEQTYHLVAHRRHNISHHTWGILSGLQVVFGADENRFWVDPGLATDGYGRELLLPRRVSISDKIFEEFDFDAVDVWLEYRETRPVTANDDGECRIETPAASFRITESTLVTFTRADALKVDRRCPEAVKQRDDCNFSPEKELPLGDDLRWPVFLGQIRRDLAADPISFTVLPQNRPYAGVRAELIEHPTGTARVKVGTGNDSRPPGFAVHLAAPDPPFSCWQTTDEAHVSKLPVIEIEGHGKTTLRCETTIVDGKLILQGGPDGGIEFCGPKEPEVNANPDSKKDLPFGRIYHYFGPKPTKAKQTTDDPKNDKERIRQLRLILHRPDDNLKKYDEPTEFVIGKFADDDFKAILTVRTSAGNEPDQVNVNGNLFVEGIFEADRSSDRFDEQAQAQLLAAFQSGLGSVLSKADGSQIELLAMLKTNEGQEFIRSLLGKADPDKELAQILKDKAKNWEIAGKLLEGGVGADSEIRYFLAGTATVPDVDNDLVTVLLETAARWETAGQSMDAGLGADSEIRKFLAGTVTVPDVDDDLVKALLETAARWETAGQSMDAGLGANSEIRKFLAGTATVPDVDDDLVKALLEIAARWETAGQSMDAGLGANSEIRKFLAGTATVPDVDDDLVKALLEIAARWETAGQSMDAGLGANSEIRKFLAGTATVPDVDDDLVKALLEIAARWETAGQSMDAGLGANSEIRKFLAGTATVPDVDDDLVKALLEVADRWNTAGGQLSAGLAANSEIRRFVAGTTDPVQDDLLTALLETRLATAATTTDFVNNILTGPQRARLNAALP